MKKDEYILGISAFYHDSSACILKNGKIMAAVSEERFSRKKHDDSFPQESINFCLNYAKISANDLSAVVFYEKPLLKFERILLEFIKTWPFNFWQFFKFMPIWLSKKLWINSIITKKIWGKNSQKIPIYYTNHHISHASATYFTSPFSSSTILTLDGVGEGTTTAIFTAKNNQIFPQKEIIYPDSLGLFYSAFTFYLGFKVNGGEYKMMGLAPYGKPIYTDKIREIIKIHQDGSFSLNQKYFTYRFGLKMVGKKFVKFWGQPIRNTDDEILQFHKDLSASVQKITEEIILKMVKFAKRKYPSKNLCLSGGVALNCVANGKILREKIFENIYIFPACGDDGGAVGSALFYANLKNKNEKIVQNFSPYLGLENNNQEIESFLKTNKIPFQKLNEEKIITLVSEKIANENFIIGHFNGRMEFGPRALGNRSILADPRNKENWKKVNLKIKFRESFRPFAPSVAEEDLQKYFDINVSSPYMLFTAPVKVNNLPAITHLNKSARIQSVNEKQNPRFHKILKKFAKFSGVSVLINTSFNVRGEPIVCDFKEAFFVFLHTEMEAVVLNNFFVQKSDLNIEKLRQKFPRKSFLND